MQRVPFLQGSFSEQNHTVNLWVQSTRNIKQADASEGSKCKIKHYHFYPWNGAQTASFQYQQRILQLGSCCSASSGSGGDAVSAMPHALCDEHPH